MSLPDTRNVLLRVIDGSSPFVGFCHLFPGESNWLYDLGYSARTQLWQAKDCEDQKAEVSNQPGPWEPPDKLGTWGNGTLKIFSVVLRANKAGVVISVCLLNGWG